MARGAIFAVISFVISVLGAAAAQDAPPLIQPGPPGGEAKALTPAQSKAMGASRFIPEDVRFMQHMIMHHQQAVDMVAMISDRTTTEAVRDIGNRISQSQAAEIEFMRSWLTDREQPVRDKEMMKMHHRMMKNPDMPMMTGMLSPNQMKALKASRGVAFDQLFLSGMILHHEGALRMVRGLLSIDGAGEDPALSEFLSSVVADQTAEIIRMSNILSALDAD